MLPGTTVVTDAWRGYQNVAQINNRVYDHAVIVHAREFVDSVDPDIHTETIEGLWMQAKRKLRYQSGTSRGLFASYLGAFLWRHSHQQNVFGCYLQMLCANYRISSCYRLFFTVTKGSPVVVLLVYNIEIIWDRTSEDCLGVLYLHLSTQQANNMQKTRIAQYNIPFCILRKTKKR